ncbi:MAG: histidine kinase, partial [Phormidium sp. GEM2.Bin31]
MWDLLDQLIQAIFSPSQSYMPHGHCYLWQTPLVALHVTSDALIALAYFSIPALLIYFVLQRRDVPFLNVFYLFGAFIILCGLGHLMDIWTLWHPAYWLAGVERAMTALVSCYTAASMVTLLPQFLSLKTPKQLEML